MVAFRIGRESLGIACVFSVLGVVASERAEVPRSEDMAGEYVPFPAFANNAGRILEHVSNHTEQRKDCHSDPARLNQHRRNQNRAYALRIPPSFRQPASNVQAADRACTTCAGTFHACSCEDYGCQRLEGFKNHLGRIDRSLLIRLGFYCVRLRGWGRARKFLYGIQCADEVDTGPTPRKATHG